MKFIYRYVVFITLLVSYEGRAQIGLKLGTSPGALNASSILDLSGVNNRGLLLPRVALTSTSAATPLNAHVAGMVVYNTTSGGGLTPGIYFNTGSAWVHSSSNTSNDLSNYNLIIRGTDAGAGDVADQTMLTLFRNGVSFQRFSPAASLNLGGFSSGSSAASRLSIRLGNGNVSAGATDSEVMTLLSNGNVGIGTSSSTSKLQVNGSVATSIIKTTANLTLDETHYTVIISGGTPTITLPAASSCPGRIYIIVNRTVGARSISNYRTLSDQLVGSVTQSSSITLQSDGSEWNEIL